MRNFLIVVATTCLFTPPACLFTPQAMAQTKQQQANPQPAPSADDHARKALTAKGGTLLNSNPKPEEAKKTAEVTNRQILEKRRHKR